MNFNTIVNSTIIAITFSYYIFKYKHNQPAKNFGQRYKKINTAYNQVHIYPPTLANTSVIPNANVKKYEQYIYNTQSIPVIEN